jgi:hypothetical protein
MDRQPTYNAMQRARKMVRDLEALNSFELGPQSWQIIERTFAEQEAAQERAYESELAAVRAERDKLRAALVEIRDMPFSVRFSQMFERAQNIARAALDEGGA